MLRWTVKSLLLEPFGFLLTAGAVGGAFLLVIFFEAVFAGESEKIVAYLEKTDPDLWVMQRGVSNMHMATSLIWDWKQDRVAAVDGVAKVTPILYLNSVVEAGGRAWFSFIVGLDPDDPRAGPWAMAQGRAIPGPGEAVVPAVLAEMTGLKLGDQIRITDRAFTIVGLTRGTFSMANSITFVTRSAIEHILSLTGSVSYLLVDAEPGIDTAVLAARIRENVEKVNVVESAAFIESDRAMAMMMGVELIQLMTIIGAGLAVVLVSFTVFVFVSGKRRDLAVVKALGVTNGAIYASAILQATCIATAGVALAILLAYAAVPITNAFVPQISLQITASALVRVSVLAVIVAVLASLISVRQVVRVDPLTAFQQ